ALGIPASSLAGHSHFRGLSTAPRLSSRHAAPALPAPCAPAAAYEYLSDSPSPPHAQPAYYWTHSRAHDAPENADPASGVLHEGDHQPPQNAPPHKLRGKHR